MRHGRYLLYYQSFPHRDRQTQRPSNVSFSYSRRDNEPYVGSFKGTLFSFDEFFVLLFLQM